MKIFYPECTVPFSPVLPLCKTNSNENLPFGKESASQEFSVRNNAPLTFQTALSVLKGFKISWLYFTLSVNVVQHIFVLELDYGSVFLHFLSCTICSLIP